jgi:2-phospho-L-lactate guanylyltransferase
MNTRLVVVPMKDPSESKTRLKATVSAVEREDLARSLFLRTLDLLNDIKAQVPVDLAVVTGSDEIRDLAGQNGAAVIAEPARGGLNQALDRAADWAVERGYHSLCILPADLAAPTCADLIQLLSHPLTNPGAVLCPAQDLGTNALMVSPPDGLGFAYGPRSFPRHFDVATRAGLAPIMLPLTSLKRDVDRSADLTRMLRDTPDFAPDLARSLHLI